MGKSLTRKILESHLVEGEWKSGSEIGIRIDQTLTQDATGTMAYLQFEAMGIESLATELSVSYVDHNTLQTGFENADDHRYLLSIARRYGIRLSRAGNGICHQVHLERFGKPGATLLGSDSHTPTGGGIGMAAIGAGGLDVALAMGGAPFYLPCPEVVRVRAEGPVRTLGLGQGPRAQNARDIRHQGQRRPDLRIRRARPRAASRCPSARRSRTWAPSAASPPRSSRATK